MTKRPTQAHVERAPEAQPRPNLRRRKLPQPQFQLRMSGAFAGLCTLAMVVHTLVMGVALLRLSARMEPGGAQLFQALPTLLFTSLLLSMVVVLPCLVFLGVGLLFRVAGPLYRMERHLAEVRDGEWPEPCKIRKGDSLQEFCSLLNQSLEAARQHGHRQALLDAEHQRGKNAA